MERIQTDVAVLGTGAAGMTAAITAAEAGARVVVLEKRPYPGGASNMPVGFRVIRKDRAYRDKAFQVHMDMTRWSANTDLVRAFIDMSGEIPEWLSRTGVELIAPTDRLPLEEMGKPWKFGGFPAGYNLGDFYFLKARGRGHGGSMMIRRLVKKAEELGVDIRLGTPGKKILKAGRKISGVLAEKSPGEDLHVDAKTVVVATAGFNDDAEMIKKHSVFGFKLDRDGTCQEGDLFFLCPNLRHTGDGIKMAWAVGADKGGMGISALPHIPGPGIIGHMPWINVGQLIIVAEQPYLWVNQDGKRFMDETQKTDHVTTANILARQREKCAVLIFDEDTRRQMEKALDFIYFIFPAEKLDDVEGDMKNAIDLGNKHVFIADTLEDLANQADIDKVELQRTVDAYNQCCEKGHDDQFAKNPKFLRPVKKGKFYGVRTYCSSYGTVGGIKVNGRTEALAETREVIPGLYAAGDIIVGDIYGDPPILGLTTLDFALTSGRIAGKSVLEYLGKR
jgi:fumarate reductase flavoprotein subunit